MKIDEKIRNRRLELRLTIEQVADRVGVAKSTIQRWESGYTASIKQSKLMALAKALCVPPTYLVFEDEELKPQKSESEIEDELIALSRKMTIAQKVRLLNYAYDIVGGDK